MQNYFEDLKNYGEKSFKTSRELAEINVKTLEELSDQYMAVAKLLVETSTEQFNLIGKSDNYKEVIGFQTELTSELNGKLMGIARNAGDIYTEHKEKCAEWFDNSVKQNSAYIPKL